MKTKKQRQAWWKGLSPDQKSKYIDKKVEKKRLKRNKLMAKSMKAKGLKYNCAECIHRKTQNCTDITSVSCEYFYKVA